MKRLLFFALTLTICSFSSTAQTKYNPWSIGIQAGTQQYNGELGNQFFKYTDHYNGLAGFSVGRYLSKHLTADIDLTLGDIKFKEDVERKADRFDYNMYQANLHLTYNFLHDEVQFRPFVFAGIGFIQFSSRGRDESNLSTPAAGFGVNYRINDHVNLRYQNTLLLSDYDELDNRTGGGNDSYLQTTVGIYATILATQDEDRDGIADKNDLCPGTPPGTRVNRDGCPKDRDEDGVVNEEDKCPDVAGLPEFNGCPDSDGDGITDADDPCPNQAGSAEMGGCPDGDNDGIADNLDKCPTEAGIAELEGCPEIKEAIKRGVYTYNKLPLQNGTLVIYDEKGEAVDTVLTNAEGFFEYTQLDPDKNYTIRPIEFKGDDNKIDIYLVDDKGEKTHSTRKRDDGLFVFTPAAAEPTGTTDKPGDPVASKPKEDKPSSTAKPAPGAISADLLTNIQFNSSSSAVNIKYYKQLDQLAAAVKKSGESVEIILEGHADSSGPEDYNNRLAIARADRVKRYMMSKGLDADRFQVIGKGIKEPLVSNATPEGRAKNRRVEIRIK